MPVLDHLSRRDALAGLAQTFSLAERAIGSTLHTLVARVNVPFNSSSPPGLIQANKQDPFKKSGKYALVWVYFGIILLVFATLLHFFHSVTDRLRTALHEDEVQKSSITSSPSTDYEMAALQTDKSTLKLFPRNNQLEQSSSSSLDHFELAILAFRPFNFLIAAFRFIFYRPAPKIQLRKQWRPVEFPSLSVIIVGFAGLAMSVLYCFLPQPLYWQSMQFGSPPLGIRAGMMALAMLPWIIAMSMKANIVSVLTGIGHERLNVLHRWGGYLCLFLSLVHAVPFYVQRGWDPAGYVIYQTYFQTNGLYIFGTG
jgi:Ferric reductase like transmembrane component